MRRSRVFGAIGCLLALVLVGCGADEATETADEGAPNGAADGGEDQEETHEDADSDAQEVSEPQPRLLVADAVEPHLAVVDLLTEEVLATIDIVAPNPIMAADPNGRVAAVSQPAGDVTHLIDVGAWAIDHGDHGHYYVGAPRELDRLDLDVPIHTSAGHGLFTIFADGAGAAHVIDESDLVEHGHTHDVSIDSGSPHHGGAIPIAADLVAVSAPDPDQDGGLADEVAVYHDGVEIGRYDCPGLHGEAAVDGGGAFACEDRVLMLRADGEQAEEIAIDYPDSVDRVGYLAGHPDHAHVAAADGDQLLIVDTDGGEVVAVADLPAPAASYAHIDADGNLLVVTEDGAVHQVDLDSGDLLASSEETVNFGTGDDDPGPSIAGGRERVYVSSPEDGSVLEFATNDDLRLARTLDLGGTPTGLAYFGALW